MGIPLVPENNIIIIYSPENQFRSGLVETKITVTGGVVGPTIAQSGISIPINVTSVLSRPQVTY